MKAFQFSESFDTQSLFHQTSLVFTPLLSNCTSKRKIALITVPWTLQAFPLHPPQLPLSWRATDSGSAAACWHCVVGTEGGCSCWSVIRLTALSERKTTQRHCSHWLQPRPTSWRELIVNNLYLNTRAPIKGQMSEQMRLFKRKSRKPSKALIWTFEGYNIFWSWNWVKSGHFQVYAFILCTRKCLDVQRNALFLLQHLFSPSVWTLSL